MGIIDFFSCDRYWLYTFSVYVLVHCRKIINQCKLMTCDFLSQLGIWFLAFEWSAIILNYQPILDHLEKYWQYWDVSAIPYTHFCSCQILLVWASLGLLSSTDPYLGWSCFNVNGVDWPFSWCTKCKHYLYVLSWANWAVSTVVLFLFEATCT